MTPFLSFIVFLLILAGLVIGLVNVIRKYRNPAVKLKWVLIPFFISLASLIINLSVGRNEWNMKTMISELNPQSQDSSENENKSLSDLINQKDEKRIVKKSKKYDKESQSIKDTLIATGQESEPADRIIPGRIITPEQRSKFVNFLRDEPKGSIRIASVAGDAEAFQYAGRVSEMLKAAGYSLSGGISNFKGNEAVQGISIVINRNETEPRYARSVFLAFRSIGINISAERNKQLVKPLEVLISVGHKK